MPSKEEIEAALSQVLVPRMGRSLAQLNMIREVEVINDRVKVTLASTALDSATQEWVEAKARAVLEELNEIKEVAVEFVEAKPQELNQIGRVLAIMSGKGGVGKSLVTGLLAIALFADGLSGQGWNGIGAETYREVAGQGVTGFLAAPGMVGDGPGQLIAQAAGIGALALLGLFGGWLVMRVLGLLSPPVHQEGQ